MNELTPINIFSVAVSILGLFSFVVNLYQYFKIQSLKQAIESLDGIAKSAKIECARLEKKETNEAASARIRVVSGIVSQMLNVTTVFLKYRHKHFEKKGGTAPFISVD
jgi:hypothetical protein